MMPEDHHKQRTIMVPVDVDDGVADFVLYLNTIPGVRTHASCQGTIGEGGPAPYRPQVMCTWTPEAFERLKAEFDITLHGDGTWGYVHPREGWISPSRTELDRIRAEARNAGLEEAAREAEAKAARCFANSKMKLVSSKLYPADESAARVWDERGVEARDLAAAIRALKTEVGA